MSARDRRDQRNEATGTPKTAAQLAFEQGKRAGLAGKKPGSATPYRAAVLREAWDRGVQHGYDLRSGLRPLDTARRLP